MSLPEAELASGRANGLTVEVAAREIIRRGCPSQVAGTTWLGYPRRCHGLLPAGGSVLMGLAGWEMGLGVEGGAGPGPAMPGARRRGRVGRHGAARRPAPAPAPALALAPA